jgi:gliding motility-associated-like protein
MKKIIFYIILFVANLAYGQQFIVESGSLSIGKNTVVSVQQTSITSNGSIASDTSGTIALIGGSLPLGIGGSSTIQTGNLKIGGNCSLNTDMEVKANIYFSSGILDLNNSDIVLKGKLEGENEQTRAFSSGNGRLITWVDLKEGNLINPGNLGLSITPLSDYSQAEMTRGHEQQLNNSKLSIYRVYSLPLLNDNPEIVLNYFDAELTGLSENGLRIWGELNGEWQTINNSSINVAENNATALLAQGYTKITLFESAENTTHVVIPNGFSPNGDGENDVFVIDGAELLPDNKLTIINQWGDVLYEASPYENDWEGENSKGHGSKEATKLMDGTYFYIFFKEKNNKKTVLNGFVEIKTGDR